MNRHVDNVFNKIMEEVEKGFYRFADDVELKIDVFEHDLDNIYINYRIIQGGKIDQIIETMFDKRAQKLVDGINTMILYTRKDKENFVMRDGTDIKWNEIFVESVLPIIENQIYQAVKNIIKNEEGFIEDYIVDYEESDERGEYSYFVSEYDLTELLDNIEIHINTNEREIWDIESVVDKWEENQR